MFRHQLIRCLPNKVLFSSLRGIVFVLLEDYSGIRLCECCYDRNADVSATNEDIHITGPEATQNITTRHATTRYDTIQPNPTFHLYTTDTIQNNTTQHKHTTQHDTTRHDTIRLNST